MSKNLDFAIKASVKVCILVSFSYIPKHNSHPLLSHFFRKCKADLYFFCNFLFSGLPKRKISTMLRNSIRRKKSVAKKNSDSNFNRFAKEENDESISLTDISKPNNNCKHPTKSPTPPRNSADTPEIFISVTNHTPSESPSDSQILRNGDIRRDFSSSLTDLRSSPEEFDRLLLPDSQNMRLCSSEGNVATMKTELSANPGLERSCSQSRIIGAKPPLVSAGTTQKVAQV